MTKIEITEFENIKNLYLKQKLTLKEIAKIYNVSSSGIGIFLKRNGFISQQTNAKRISVNESFFEKIDSEEKAYWLGFLYADGCLHIIHKKYINAFSLGLSIHDEAHLLKFKKNLKAEQKTYKTFPKPHFYKEKLIKGNGIVTLKISRKKMCEDLIKLGCMPRKSLTVQFPTSEQVPDHLIHHFIRGYFDGDGGYTTRKSDFTNHMQYNINLCGSQDFLNKLSEILHSKLNINKYIPFKVKNNKIYKLNFGGNKVIRKISDFIYQDSTIFLERKNKIYLRLLKQRLYDNTGTENNARAKKFSFKHKDGRVVNITNLCKFCRDNGYYPCKFYKVLRGETKAYRGWMKI